MLENDLDGYLYITGKKEIYVSRQGKYCSQVIEETMKSIPIVSQCFLVGEKKILLALFTLDVGAILRDKLWRE